MKFSILGKFLTILLTVLFFSPAMVMAKEFKAAVSENPVSNIYVKLLEAMDEETSHSFDIKILPPKRCVALVETGKIDFNLPQTEITDPETLSKLLYEFSTTYTFEVNYVLYYNKNLDIDVDELKNGNPKNYKIETELSQVPLFSFPILSSTNIESSLLKVNMGRIDGFIYAAAPIEGLLKTLKLDNISKTLFQKYKSKLIIKKGAKGTEVDRVLSETMKKIKANGKFEEILGGIMAANSGF